MNLDQLVRRKMLSIPFRARVQIVNVLRDEQELMRLHA